MELTCLFTIISMVAFGYLFAWLSNKKLFVIKNGKYCREQSYPPKKIIITVSTAIVMFFCGIIFCIADIRKTLENDTIITTIIAVTVLLLTCVFGLAVLGMAIRNPSLILDFQIPGIYWNKTINRCSNIFLFVVWLAVTIFLAVIFQTFNCVVLGSAGWIALIMTGIILLIINILTILFMLASAIYKLSNKFFAKH